MIDVPSNIWIGKSGNKYRYWIYDYTHSFPSKPGNFIITRLFSSDWLPIYLGHTDDLSTLENAISNITCVEQCFPTHIHTHYNPESDLTRQEEVQDLLEQHNLDCQS